MVNWQSLKIGDAHPKGRLSDEEYLKRYGHPRREDNSLQKQKSDNTSVKKATEKQTNIFSSFFNQLTFDEQQECKNINTRVLGTYSLNWDRMRYYGISMKDIENANNGDVFFNFMDVPIGENGMDLLNDPARSKEDNIYTQLINYTKNRTLAIREYGNRWDLEIKPKLQRLIKASPKINGEVWRAEDLNRGELTEGMTVNFDCQSTADDGAGYSVASNFIQYIYESGEGVRLFKFPHGVRGLNIQSCSAYPNQHEYLVDGDFIVDIVETDEYGREIITLKFKEGSNE